MTNADKIREYQKANPTATPKQVAEALKLKTVTVHQLRWFDKNRASKKKKLVNRRRQAVAPVAPSIGQIVVRNQMISQDERIDRLLNQNAQLRAVVSYLERQLGLKDSQHGPAI